MRTAIWLVLPAHTPVAAGRNEVAVAVGGLAGGVVRSRSFHGQADHSAEAFEVGVHAGVPAAFAERPAVVESRFGSVDDMVYLQRFDAWRIRRTSGSPGAMALLRVLSPVTPNDGQVQHAAAFGHEQGQQPVGEVVEVGGFLEHGFHGRSTHHDQAVNVAGAVGVLPAAVGQTPHRRCPGRFVGQCFVGVGHHGLRAGIQRVGQLCEGAGFVQIVGIDEGHQRQACPCA